jgi:polysaccharide biosynthesis/export protein
MEQVIHIAAVALSEGYGGAHHVDVPVGVHRVPFLQKLLRLPFRFAVVVERVFRRGFVGKIKASGLSRWQLQEQITQALAEKKMLTDGLVTVEFMNFKVSILGEVTNPGTYTINSDKVTVLEAIAMAKDLTIFGERDHVYVIREENGQRKSYQLDLRSADIFKSPAYYLKQNDVVYVQPNSVRAGQSTINQNAMKSVSLWISIASLLTSIGVLVVNIAKKD